MEVKEDPDGLLGVEVLDQSSGQYRFKRGMKDSVKLVKREGYADDSGGVCKERFEQLKNKHSQQFGGILARRGCEQHGVRSPSPQHSARAFDSAHEPRLALTETPSVSTASGSSVRGGGTCTSGGPKQSASPGSGSSVRGGRTCTSGGKPLDDSAKKKRWSTSEVTIEAAQALLDKTENETTWPQHWESKLRKREFSTMIARIATAGRKLGRVSDDGRCLGGDRPGTEQRLPKGQQPSVMAKCLSLSLSLS